MEMAAAAASGVSPLSRLCSLPPFVSPSPSTTTATTYLQKARRSAAVAFATPPSTGSEPGRPLIQQEEGSVAPTSDSNRFLPQQEDVDYLWKVAAGSVGGGAIIKYGSVLFPEITRPSILQALLMIGMPLVVAVFLLIKESNISKGQN